ncbi:MAG TPA: hypothetical protein VG986_16090 [Pseudolabrys sp.]|nr:hypothetical protein [Pseudolabrys sp.]
MTRLIATVSIAVFLVAGGSALAADNARPNKVSFYFAAHEDDWQLFMNPSAFQDVVAGARKTVFVHVTAGDGGLGLGSAGRKHPLYRARENGAEQAMRFMVNADHSPGPESDTHITLNGHSIYRVNYGSTVGYFLRVADGNLDGSGFYDTGFQSLKHLHDGAPMLAAVDASTVYHGWNDLVKTVRAIVDHERGQAAQVQINVAETNARVNPQDHSDHLMTAAAALDAVSDMPCVRRVFYVDYASAKMPENISADQRDLVSSVFAVTIAGVLAYDHGLSWRHYDKSYVGRSYFRVQDGVGQCSPARTEVAAALKR